MSIFKSENNFKVRLEKANKLLEKYPDKIPIICEKHHGYERGSLEKTKYIVYGGITLGQFLMIIRKQINIKKEEAIFLFVNNKFLPSNQQLSEIYNIHKDSDNFLYMSYSNENTFG
jgi:GABA(A) receptor-associated protein